MSAALSLVLLVVASYLAAHVAFEWLGHRLLIVSGAEYLLLGVLLGPHVSGVVSAAQVQSFAPVTALALGWMGAIIGSRLRLQQLVRVRAAMYNVALAESAITLGVVFALELFLLRWLFDLTPARAFGPALALGACAVATADAGISLATRRHGSQRALVAQLQTSAGMNAFVAVCTFSILLATTHPANPSFERQLTTTEWTVVSIAIGVAGGALFHLFLDGERRMDRLFVSLAGVIILVSGAATYLQLSPLMSAMFFGIILVNTSRQYHEVRAVLARVERPLYFVLLIIAGAMWRPSTQRALVLPVLLFLVARALCKIGGARLAARANHLLPVLGPRWGHALLGQGGLVIALAVNYLYQESLGIANVVFSTAVVSVLLTDLVSGRLASSVLEVSEDAPSPPAEPALRRDDAERAADAPLRGAENA